ncbi:uncharacterized protein BKA78DRAFT_350040 [Phyllosticta capitalensis]|uniref:Protein farnesyltransferase/geranylgeranyltransferase type-1 subunit alpha n=1 Tax=Phyllosticta capitalensis TaxID=121624 RepID=A0ABR1YZJ9_9PEZI
MGFLSDDPDWKDVEPIPLDEGGPNALAAIAYPEDYEEAMSYLRAIMAKNEMSERAYELTEAIIDANPAHYTVWLYRARIVLHMNKDLHAEMAWLNEVALRNLKNYQIWHHRQTIINKIGSAEGEQDFIKTMLEKDTKNYHVWSYRQWLVRRFDLFEQGELEAVEELLEQDVRNNSAWNHRWFLVFGGNTENFGQKKILDREIEYAKGAIKRAPQNQSPWNYLRGLLQHASLPKATLKDLALEYASVDETDKIRSSHALDLLSEVYAEEQSKEQANKALDLLAQKFDPIRRNYWKYRKTLLDQPQAVA